MGGHELKRDDDVIKTDINLTFSGRFLMINMKSSFERYCSCTLYFRALYLSEKGFVPHKTWEDDHKDSLAFEKLKTVIFILHYLKQILLEYAFVILSEVMISRFPAYFGLFRPTCLFWCNGFLKIKLCHGKRRNYRACISCRLFGKKMRSEWIHFFQFHW